MILKMVHKHEVYNKMYHVCMGWVAVHLASFKSLFIRPVIIDGWPSTVGQMVIGHPIHNYSMIGSMEWYYDKVQQVHLVVQIKYGKHWSLWSRHGMTHVSYILVFVVYVVIGIPLRAKWWLLFMFSMEMFRYGRS